MKNQAIKLRPLRAGDLGWVISQHGQIYAEEYGFDTSFEALVAGIAADFVKRFQPDWECCWIAEQGGQRLGSVFLVRKSANTAQLRMLILTPQARGQGLGARLTDEAIAFARERGYKKIVLWTNSILLSARGIYAKRGFKMMKSAPYEGFGKKLVSETWEMKL
jgi:GNAT superfamily N-acetyltransferase